MSRQVITQQCVCLTVPETWHLLKSLKPKVPHGKQNIIADAVYTPVTRYGIVVYLKQRLHKGALGGHLEDLQLMQENMLRLFAGKVMKEKVRVATLFLYP